MLLTTVPISILVVSCNTYQVILVSSFAIRLYSILALPGFISSCENPVVEIIRQSIRKRYFIADFLRSYQALCCLGTLMRMKWAIDSMDWRAMIGLAVQASSCNFVITDIAYDTDWTYQGRKDPGRQPRGTDPFAMQMDTQKSAAG
jgi:hypothetical protein